LLRLEFDRTETISLRNFYIRRALRILPPFYLVLLIACALTLLGILPGTIAPSAVLAQAFHYANYRIVCHGYDGFAPGTAVYWSLAVEEHFYLLFPLLYLWLRKRGIGQRGQAICLVLLCASILAWRCVLVYALHSATDRTYLASDTRFDSILYGCALAVLGNPVLDPQRGSDTLWKAGLLPLGGLGLLVSFLVRDAGFRESIRYSLQGVALIPVFVCAVRFPTWGPSKVLNYRPVAFIGVLTYSLYLCHQVVLFVVRGRLEARLGLPASALLSLVIAIAVAWLAQVTIERPFARLRKRFSA
jgi:peptidoglycan/LPS O-acetylase OafA/YrhL